MPLSPSRVQVEVSQGGGLQREIAGKKICNGDSATMQLDQEVLDHNMFCLLFWMFMSFPYGGKEKKEIGKGEQH